VTRVERKTLGYQTTGKARHEDITKGRRGKAEGRTGNLRGGSEIVRSREDDLQKDWQSIKAGGKMERRK